MSLFPHISLQCKNSEIPCNFRIWLNFICTFMAAETSTPQWDALTLAKICLILPPTMPHADNHEDKTASEDSKPVA